VDVETGLDTDASTLPQAVNELEATKQDNLVNQVNIKSINGDTILGEGDLNIAAGSGGYAGDLYLSDSQNVIESGYKKLSYEPDVATTTQSITVDNDGEVEGETYMFELPITTEVIDAGKWTFSFYLETSANQGDTRFRVEPFVRGIGGTETVLFSSTSPELTNDLEYVVWETTQNTFDVGEDDYLGFRVYASTTTSSSKTITYTIGDGNSSYINTPIALRHSQLRGRDTDDQHPINAIEGLQDALDAIGTETEFEGALA